MPIYQNLTGKKFGKLKVLKRLDKKEDRYYVWLCQCECGNTAQVNTKRLVRGTITNCGCIPKKTARNGQIAEDLTGRRFGKLTVLRRVKNKNNRTCWLCRCDCGREKEVSAHDLKTGKVKSCGCRQFYKGKGVKDISGKRFGRLTVLRVTDKRDQKGSVYWRCRCDCGQELDVTADSLMWGNYRSCGCLRREIQETIPKRLHRIDGTCVEILEHRKNRRDNTSGFRGVYPTKNGKYRACIGFQSKKYWLGTYETFENAVEARMMAEEMIHGGFLKVYRRWMARAEQDPKWGEENPLHFRVEKTEGDFLLAW